MVETELLREIVKFVAETVAEMRLPVKGGEPRAPQVFGGYLPPKRSGKDDDFPFVIVRPVKGAIDDASTATVNLIIGCYDEDPAGYEHCLNVLARLRTAFCARGVLASRYTLQRPITWECAEEQPYPQWLLLMTTEWVYRAPVEEHFDETDFFEEV